MNCQFCGKPLVDKGVKKIYGKNVNPCCNECAKDITEDLEFQQAGESACVDSAGKL